MVTMAPSIRPPPIWSMSALRRLRLPYVFCLELGSLARLKSQSLGTGYCNLPIVSANSGTEQLK
jgi:hypothetical protein